MENTDYDLSELGSVEVNYDEGEFTERTGWALMPCTETLFNEPRVDLREVGSVWPNCTAYVCQRGNRLYLCTSAAGSLRFRLDSKHKAFHDQTSVDLGTFTVKNIVAFKNGKVVRRANDKGFDSKLGVLTFK